MGGSSACRDCLVKLVNSAYGILITDASQRFLFEHGSKYCRCWTFSSYRMTSHSSLTCIDCPAYRRIKKFLEKPKELDLGERTLSVSSSFVEVRERNEIWEVIVFRDVTAEKTDAVAKLAGALRTN